MKTARSSFLVIGGIALSIFFCAVSTAHAANLLANADFEAPILGGPFPGPQGNWEPSDSTVAVQSAVVKSGSNALAISGPSATDWHTGDQDLAWNAGDPVFL